MYITVHLYLRSPVTVPALRVIVRLVLAMEAVAVTQKMMTLLVGPLHHHACHHKLHSRGDGMVRIGLWSQ